ncbi:MAG: hypothetical protein V5A55_08570 [Halovenus sp.]
MVRSAASHDMSVDNYLSDPFRSRYSLKLFVVPSVIVLIIVGIGLMTEFQISDRVTEEQQASIEAKRS